MRTGKFNNFAKDNKHYHREVQASINLNGCALDLSVASSPATETGISSGPVGLLGSRATLLFTYFGSQPQSRKFQPCTFYRVINNTAEILSNSLLINHRILSTN